MKFLKLFLFAIALFFIGNITSVHAGTITIVKTGSGNGVVTSASDSSLNCGTSCVTSKIGWTTFILTADSNSFTTAFQGMCTPLGEGTPTASCNVATGVPTVGNQDITAYFGTKGIPTTTIDSFSGLTDFGASISTKVSANGSAVSEYGIVWSTSPNPTTSLSTKKTTITPSNFYPASSGSAFGVDGKDLLPNTTYYFRSYVINGYGVGYSNDFPIIKTVLPDLTFVIDPLSGTSTNKHSIYSFGGLIKNVGNNTAYTPIDSLLQVATLADGKGIITDELTNSGGNYMFPFIEYYVNGTLQNYIVPGGSQIQNSGVSYLNSDGVVSYAGGFSFTQPRGTTQSFRVCTDRNPARVTESDESDASNCSAWKNVFVKRVPSVDITITPTTGNPGVTATIQWSVYNATPDSCTASGDWSGDRAHTKVTETENVGPLNEVKKYSYTLICTNADGDSDPATATITVSNPVATLTVVTGPVTAFAQTTATSSVTTGGGVNAVDAGIVWGTTLNPEVGTNMLVLNTAGNASGFKSLGMTGLTANTPYHVRAYGRTQAVHDLGGAYTYGADVTFTTSAPTTTLTVVTGPVTAFAQTTATSSVTTGGGVDALQAGIVWGTTLNPKVSNDMSVRNTGGWKSGKVSLNMTELNAGTLYHVRAYGNISATETIDTSYTYGADVTFVTKAAPNTGIWKDGTCPTTCGYSGGEIKQVCTGGNYYCTYPAPDPTICPATSACPTSCNNNKIIDNGETGIDCGGPLCPACKNPPKIIEI